MKEAVIVSAVRTPVGKAPKGMLRATRPDDLAAAAIQGALDRLPALDRREIDDVASGRADRKNNVLKNAPHTAAAIAASDWPHPYTREQAAFPLPFVRVNKFWPTVGRIDNRRLGRLAKLAGAPRAAAAGLERHVGLGQHVSRGDALLTLHAESAGEIEYALEYFGAQSDLIELEEPS